MKYSPLYQRTESQFKAPQGDVAQRGSDERKLEADVAGVAGDGPNEPYLVHRRHDDAAREYARA